MEEQERKEMRGRKLGGSVDHRIDAQMSVKGVVFVGKRPI
jgi:hypothetical protein